MGPNYRESVVDGAGDNVVVTPCGANGHGFGGTDATGAEEAGVGVQVSRLVDVGGSIVLGDEAGKWGGS